MRHGVGFCLEVYATDEPESATIKTFCQTGVYVAYEKFVQFCSGDPRSYVVQVPITF